MYSGTKIAFEAFCWALLTLFCRQIADFIKVLSIADAVQKRSFLRFKLIIDNYKSAKKIWSNLKTPRVAKRKTTNKWLPFKKRSRVLLVGSSTTSFSPFSFQRLSMVSRFTRIQTCCLQGPERWEIHETWASACKRQIRHSSNTSAIFIHISFQPTSFR